LHNQLEVLEQEKDQLHTACESLRAQLENAQAAQKQVEDMMASMQTAAAASSTDAAARDAQVVSLQARIADLEQQLAASKLNADVQADAVAALQQQIAGETTEAQHLQAMVQSERLEAGSSECS
jgi:chromosome segregation ATPase